MAVAATSPRHRADPVKMFQPVPTTRIAGEPSPAPVPRYSRSCPVAVLRARKSGARSP